MRIGLVSYRCENRNTAFNMAQIELAMKRSQGKADLLCFGEAFLQGFDAFSWDYDADREIALELSSDTIVRLKSLTVRYGIALATGYAKPCAAFPRMACLFCCADTVPGSGENMLSKSRRMWYDSGRKQI